jgi:predicted nucleic acid-binding Zn ribbon protein
MNRRTSLQAVKTQCPACGDFIPKGSSYCQTCGAALSRRKLGPKKQLIAWLIFLAVVMLLILLNLLIRFIAGWLADGERQEVKVLSLLCNLHP